VTHNIKCETTRLSKDMVNPPWEFEAPYVPSMTNFMVLIPTGLGWGATVE